MTTGVRELTVLGEFKPFGLVAEELDGKKPSSADPSPEEKYEYSLFEPSVTRTRDGSLADLDFSSPSPSSECGDHELFVRGNRLIWSSGTRIHKRYSSPSAVIMTCWCHLKAISEALLCVLQLDTLSLFGVSGEVADIPLPYAIVSIWALPFGLLLQKSADGNHRKSSSGSPLSARELSHPTREYGSVHHGSSHLHSFCLKENGAMISSHLILRHPLEEPQATYIEEKGKLTAMKDFEERTIWSSDVIPLMASYHKGKLQHSIWLVETATRSKDVSSENIVGVPTQVFMEQFTFQRIWQGKCSQSAASKVFLATDIDGLPIICFLLCEQKVLLALRLEIDEDNDEALVDIKPLASWSIPAIAAEPVTVTRPRLRVGILPFNDILVLSPENHLLLYSGNQCLCKYSMPVDMGKYLVSSNKPSARTPNLTYDSKIIAIDNGVEGRVNLTTNSGKIFRCLLGRNLISSLAIDCINAMAEGLHFSLYNRFATLLWGATDSINSNGSYGHLDSEWESFADVILKFCNAYGRTQTRQSTMTPTTAWDFLINSEFHKCHYKMFPVLGTSILNVPNSSCSQKIVSNAEDGKREDGSFHFQLLRETLDSLHALYESLKLNTLRKLDAEKLVHLLCSISASLGEASYVDYYVRDFPYILAGRYFFLSVLTPRNPPSLFEWLEDCLKKGCHFSNMSSLPHLVCKEKTHAVSWARKIVSFFSLMLGAERKGRLLSTGVYCELAKGSARSPEELTVLAMVGERFGRQQLDCLPVGVSLPLRHALDKCRESPPADWPAAAYVLVGREDLAMSCLGYQSKELDQNNLNLVAVSEPYMLHLQPVSIPSSASDIATSESKKLEETDSTFRSLEDGMEHIFNSSTQLRYGRDLRLNEVRRLLCSAKPVAIQTSINPSASDQDLQQHQLWNIAQRTTALPFGRGAFTLATTCTLLTEALIVPKLILAGRLPAQQNAMVNLDPNIRNIMELKSWPEFHNGVAAGLRLAPLEGKVSRAWIQYNNPQEPNFSHAGFLLALGLHEHLRVLTVTDVYKYLSQEHDVTTVAILLGTAASRRGTMHPELSKVLYLHIPSRHPSTLEIELPNILQSAALVSIGLLYEGSAHPLTMKILLGEIGRRSGGDNVLEREGYAVAAGYALGLVALGRGNDAFAFMDNFVDRLFQYIGEKGLYHEKSSVLTQRSDENMRNTGQIMDETQINVDVTSPGATIALALIFMKTESEVMASRIRLPATLFDLQYVRPDFILLRVIARNLIMWNRIQPCQNWIESQIPEIIRIGILKLGDSAVDGDECDLEAVIQAYVNIVTGACISLGLKYAGTRNGDAQKLLYNYACYFLNEIKHVPLTTSYNLPKGLLEYVDRGTLEICLHLIVLSLCVVMAGSGHLQTFRLLRYLRSRSSAEGHINYGIQMAVSLATGFLFLGGGMQTFSTGSSAVAALLITLYPRLPTGPNDNRSHLQAFRHLYVIAAECRWVQTLDVDTGLPVYCPLEITIKETEHYAETRFCEVSPCVLPERSVLKCIRVCGPRYWTQLIHLRPEDKPWWRGGDKTNPFSDGILYIKRKVGSCSYVDDPIGCQSLLSRAIHKVSDASDMRHSTMGNNSSSKDGSYKIDQLVSTFSAVPSLIAFAELSCDSSWKNRSNDYFQEFCSQVLFECVSKDRPALLQVYLSLYTTVGSMWAQVNKGQMIFQDSHFLSSLKLTLAYSEAVITGKLSSLGEGIIQCAFVESIRKHLEQVLDYSERLSEKLLHYMDSGRWPSDKNDEIKMDAVLLSWYLRWYSIPSPHIVKSAIEIIKTKAPTSVNMVPLLRLLLPTIEAKGLIEIEKYHSHLRAEKIKHKAFAVIE